MTSKPNSFMTRFLNHGDAPGGVWGARPGGTKWRCLFIELFVALSLSVAYYFLVKNFAYGNRNNTYQFLGIHVVFVSGFSLAGPRRCLEGAVVRPVIVRLAV